MLIRRLHKGRNCWVWDVRIYDENGKKRLYPTGHTSIKMAKEYEGRIKNEIAERKMFPERFFPKMTFKDFIPEYLKKHASKKRSYRDYESITKKLGDFFGEFYLHEITRYQVETYHCLRSEKAGVYMVNREITILKGIFTKAIEWGFLRVNTVKGLKLEKEKPRLRFLRTWEISRLIDACGKEPKAPYLTPMVIIDLNTGLRKEELLSLKWDHIDLERNILKVEEGKGGYTRYVPINETARMQLKKLMEKRRGDFVIHDQYGRRIKDIKRSFGSAIERADLQDVRFHDLRRTFGTLCVFNNIPPKTLQKWMGHKSIETTMKYYVVSPEDFEQDVIKRLDVWIEKSADTQTDTSKEKGLQDIPQTLDIPGGPWRDRTSDPLIKSQLLYQLS